MASEFSDGAVAIAARGPVGAWAAETVPTKHEQPEEAETEGEPNDQFKRPKVVRRRIACHAPSDVKRPQSERQNRDPSEQLPLVARGSRQRCANECSETGGDKESDMIDEQSKDYHLAGSGGAPWSACRS